MAQQIDAQEVDEYVDLMVHAYLLAGLWSSTDERHIEDPDRYPDEMLDATYALEDISEDAWAEARAQCRDFAESNWADLQAAATLRPNFYDAAQAGHDFWLTRNGHGVGFWDRDLGEVGERLTENAKPYGEASLYVETVEVVYYSG